MMVSMDHDEPKLRRRWTWYLAAVIALLLVVYPLSIGPAAWLVQHEYIPSRVARTVYMPLTFLLRQSSAIENLYGRYLELWVDFRHRDQNP